MRGVKLTGHNARNYHGERGKAMNANETWSEFLTRTERERREYNRKVYPVMRAYLAALLKLPVDSWPTNAEMVSFFGPLGAHSR